MPLPWQLPSDVVLEHLASETGEHTDDWRLITSAPDFIFIQVKRTIPNSDRAESEIANVWRQFIGQCLAGVGQPVRQLERRRDRIILVVGPNTPATVRVHLREALSRVRGLAPSDPLERAARNQSERMALTTALSLIRQLWTTLATSTPTDEELRRFLALVQIEELHLEEGAADYAAIQAILRSAVLVSPDHAPAAWSTLCQMARELAARRTGVSRSQIIERLWNVCCYVRDPNLSEASPECLRAILTSLDRVAHRNPGSPAASALRSYLAEHLDRLAEPALDIAVQTCGPIVTVLVEVLTLQGTPELRQRLHTRMAGAMLATGGVRTAREEDQPVYATATAPSGGTDSTDPVNALSRLRSLLAGGPPEPPLRPELDAVSRAFGAASRLLLGWPQETDGHWIERPELEHLHALTLQPEPALAVLLGEPGVGKSALLARLGNRLRDEGVVLLALKADQLHREIATLADLDCEIGAPMPVVDALRFLARGRRVVLLIDQLDALAELMDQHSQRLSALLRLVDAVSGVPNLQVVLSCREFEFRHDVRLATLQAEAVTLARPAWEHVVPLLAARDLDPERWSEEVREILRTPQHLAMFLTHLADRGGSLTFTTYHGLLEEVVERLERDFGPRTVEAAECIATAMGEEEQLSLGAARFHRAWRDELRKLKAAGVLVSDDRLSLMFRHQTLFEFLRSRAFLRDGTSLADYVLREKQESLFVRPLLWSALHYLRGADRSLYRREFGRLWVHTGLRRHLRYLLIAFLGQLGDPDDQEALWLLPTLDDPELRRRTLSAMAGSPGWFERLRGRLTTLMAAPPETAWHTVGLLRKAIEFQRDAVLTLVERHWLPRAEYDVLTFRAIEDQKTWDVRGVELASRLVERSNIAPMFVQELAESVSQSQADLAPVVIVRYLEAQLHQISASQQPVPEPPPEGAPPDEWLMWRMEYRESVYRPIQRLLEDGSGWHNLDKLAVRAPNAFIGRIWPWLLRILGRLVEEPNPSLNRYRSHQGLSFTRGDGDDAPRDAPLPRAIEAASRAFAEADPDSFLAFVGEHKGHDLMAIHHILALGLERVAHVHPRAGLDYLLEDPRRFAIGDVLDVHRDSRRLIAAVVPHVSAGDRLRLEQAIIRWRYYSAIPADEDAKARFERRRWSREHRLRLLRAFPVEHLSEKGRRHLLEEERALPHTRDCDIGPVNVGWIGSPMTAAQMAAASDNEVVALFEELVDATGWDHPRGRWADHRGGSIPASRQFAAFAKDHPGRALRILERFQPGLQERPAGAALAALGESETVPPAELVRQIEVLNSRGFASQHFRWEAAGCLRAVARRQKGLDDATCALVERWLGDWEPSEPVQDDSEIAHESRRRAGDDPEDRTESLLWGYGRSMVLPWGNYPALEALTLGYLLREPMAADQWLDALERHLPRREDPEVWDALAHQLRFLVHAERGRAVAFLERLFAAYPSILHDVRGVRLIGGIHRWLPVEMVARIIDGWAMAGWPRGPQAAGEVAALRLCHEPEEAGARERVERYIAGADYGTAVVAGLRLGVAHTLVQAWAEPPLRSRSTPVLLRLLPLADRPLANALHSIFAKADPLPTDGHTRLLLQALLAHPDILVPRDPVFLVDRLKDLLREGWEPDLVHDVVVALLDRAGSELGDIQSAWAGQAGDLVEIALTLHRMPETRSRGLDLFEWLMAVDAYGLSERLGILDRRPFR